MIRLINCFSLIFALCLLVPGQGRSGDAVMLRIGGTGGALGGIREVAEAFRSRHPEILIDVAPSLGSSGGIKALLSGALDIALSARPLTGEERGQGAAAEEYAQTLFVFATSHDGAGIDLTLPQLALIYQGDMKTWPDGTPLRLILRPAGEADIVFLKGMSTAMEKAVLAALSREGMITAITDQENADTIDRIRGGFGTSTLAQIFAEHRPLRMLPLNGVRPSIGTLKDGSYPYRKRLFIVTGPHRTGAVRSFIRFLFSEKGRSILTRTGHLVPGDGGNEKDQRPDHQNNER